MLTSARAPSIGDGVELSRTINALLTSTLPDVFGDVASEAVALPDTMPYGEVHVHAFYFTGCDAIDGGADHPLTEAGSGTPVATPPDEDDQDWVRVSTDNGDLGWIREIDLRPYP